MASNSVTNYGTPIFIASIVITLCIVIAMGIIPGL